MAYTSLIHRRRRRGASTSSSSITTDSDLDDDSGQGQDCIPEPKLLRERDGFRLSDVYSSSTATSAATSSTGAGSSSGLGTPSYVEPTNYVSISSGKAYQQAFSEGKVSADCGRAPNWDALLFGGNESLCQEILTYPESDTYFEDCKLAGDVALNMLGKNYDIPVFNSLRNCNQNQVTSALKSLRKSRGVNKHLTENEELLAYSALLDFVTCCCQEGNLFTLYEKCKDYRKILHIGMLDEDLRILVDNLKSKNINLKQLQSLEKFVLSSLERIPKSLGIRSHAVKFALQRKIKSFEEAEKNRHEKSEYTFDDAIPEPPLKKFKQSTVTKTKRSVVDWRERTISPCFLPEPLPDDFSNEVEQTSTPKMDSVNSAPSTSNASRGITSMKVVNTPTTKLKPGESKFETSNVSYVSPSKQRKSPYKSSKLAWNSKYVSPSKQTVPRKILLVKKALDQRADIMNCVPRNVCLSQDKPIATSSQAAAKYKSPMKCGSQVLVRKEPGRSPLKVKVNNSMQSFILARKDLAQSLLKSNSAVKVKSFVNVNLKDLPQNLQGQPFIRVNFKNTPHTVPGQTLLKAYFKKP